MHNRTDQGDTVLVQLVEVPLSGDALFHRSQHGLGLARSHALHILLIDTCKWGKNTIIIRTLPFSGKRFVYACFLES